MAAHPLSEHFAYFFSRLNPSPSFESQASSQYTTIKALIEDPNGPARELSPRCFLQGSYRQATAIYTINDIDIVVLCELWQPPSGGVGVGRSWSRDDIFNTVAAPLFADGRYRAKVRYGPQSMCIKVDLGIKVEILPVVYKHGNNDASVEPFRLYRPEAAEWQDGFARYHQQWLTWKNSIGKTGSNFIPMIKVLKHLRSVFDVDAVSFHLECLLFNLADDVFRGTPADYIPSVLSAITAMSAEAAWIAGCMTPCKDRDVLSESEWGLNRWHSFHELAKQWSLVAQAARDAPNRSEAIALWRLLLRDAYFPETVTR
jgi:hypothetical protein